MASPESCILHEAFIKKQLFGHWAGSEWRVPELNFILHEVPEEDAMQVIGKRGKGDGGRPGGRVAKRKDEAGISRKQNVSSRKQSRKQNEHRGPRAQNVGGKRGISRGLQLRLAAPGPAL